MKKIIELYKKEERLPYVIVLVVALGAVAMSLLDPIIAKMESTSKEITSFTDLAPDIGIGLASALLLVFCIIAIMRAVKHDRVYRTIKKDEREVLHDYLVTNAGYRVAIFGLCGYIFFVGDVFLLVILIAVLVIRLQKRAQVESEI